MQDDLHIIILAAGNGSRMQSNLPKPMHPIGNRPMLGHVLDTANGLGPKSCSVVIAPADRASAHFVSPTPTIVQPVPRGTGDAVRCALSDMRISSGTILVLYGDAPLVRTGTLKYLLNVHRTKGNAVTVLGFESETPGNYGRLITCRGDSLDRIVEAKDADKVERMIKLCNGGIMALDAAKVGGSFDKMTNANASKEYYLTDVVGMAGNAGHHCGFALCDEQELQGANDRRELVALERQFQARMRERILLNGVTLVEPETVFFSWDTKIESDVYVEPHVVFGPGVEIKSGAVIHAFSHLSGATVSEDSTVGPFARLRPGTRVGRSVRVGNFVEIKNSLIEDGAKVPHLTYLGDSAVGERANIGAGTITCNYDGFAKHSTLIGAGAFVGSNSTLIAPLTIGPEAIVAGGSVVTDDVEADGLALGRARQVVKPKGAALFRDRNNVKAKAV